MNCEEKNNPCDFLGRKLEIGDHVVGLVYARTSASLQEGFIVKFHDKMATVAFFDRDKERKFSYSKIVKI
jgi:hypothetical protein